ncbi:Uncharacterised protein [Mycobacteroides abscessus subsp. abscessus]|nr:Uncharacterised protein [Mycobacteroides abscessus subsp. abscessus]
MGGATRGAAAAGADATGLGAIGGTAGIGALTDSLPYRCDSG